MRGVLKTLWTDKQTDSFILLTMQPLITHSVIVVLTCRLYPVLSHYTHSIAESSSFCVRAILGSFFYAMASRKAQRKPLRLQTSEFEAAVSTTTGFFSFYRRLVTIVFGRPINILLLLLLLLPAVCWEVQTWLFVTQRFELLLLWSWRFCDRYDVKKFQFQLPASVDVCNSNLTKDNSASISKQALKMFRIALLVKPLIRNLNKYKVQLDANDVTVSVNWLNRKPLNRCWTARRLWAGWTQQMCGGMAKQGIPGNGDLYKMYHSM